MSTFKTPLRIGSYDDAGMVVDADGTGLFTVGHHEATRDMTSAQEALANEIVEKINTYELLVDSRSKGWALAKSLQAQIDELTTTHNTVELGDEMRALPDAVVKAVGAALTRQDAQYNANRERMHDLHTLLYKIAHQSTHHSAATIIRLASDGLNEIYERRGPI